MLAPSTQLAHDHKDRSCAPQVPQPSHLSITTLPGDVIGHLATYLSACEITLLRQTARVHRDKLTTRHILLAASAALARLGVQYALSPGTLAEITGSRDACIAGGAAINVFRNEVGNRADMKRTSGDIDIYATEAAREVIKGCLLADGYDYNAENEAEDSQRYQDSKRLRAADPEMLLTGASVNPYDMFYVTQFTKVVTFEMTTTNEARDWGKYLDPDMVWEVVVPVPVYATIDLIVSDRDPIDAVRDFDYTVNQVAVRAGSVHLVSDQALADLATSTLRLTDSKKQSVLKLLNQAIARAGVVRANATTFTRELKCVEQRLMARMEKYARKGFDVALVHAWHTRYFDVQARAMETLVATVRVLEECGYYDQP
jgi:hypothetical protein